MEKQERAEYMRKYREENPVIRLHINKDLYNKVKIKCANLGISNTKYLTNLIKEDIER